MYVTEITAGMWAFCILHGAVFQSLFLLSVHVVCPRVWSIAFRVVWSLVMVSWGRISCLQALDMVPAARRAALSEPLMGPALLVPAMLRSVDSQRISVSRCNTYLNGCVTGHDASSS